MKSSSFQ